MPFPLKMMAHMAALAPAVFTYESAYRQMRKSQWWPRERLAAERTKKLSALIRHVAEKVPYYSRVFREAGIAHESIRDPEDLRRLPVLEKKILNSNFDDLVSSDFPPSRLMYYSTGGSTGLPTRFYHDTVEMAWTEAAVHLTYNWAGYCRGEKFLLVSGLPGEKTSIIGRLRRLQGQRRVSLFGAGEKEIAEVVDYLLRLRPRGIKGYVSWLRIIARELAARKASWRPAHVITSSEKVTPDDRAVLREGFGVEPFENYSSREFMLAAECEQHKGLHIAAENVIIETVRNGKPVGPGEWGEILVTDLNRYGMPLIRYAIGDVGVLSDRVCPCGRGLPILEEVVGRVSDIIKTPDGKLIAAPAVAHIFKDLPVKIFRVIQESEKELQIRVVKAPGYGLEHEAHIKNSFSGINVHIEYVDDIPVVASGKNVIVQSRLKNPINTES
jgi:phenylacetate-CoA ligase